MALSWKQAYSISLMESWEPYLDFYKPNIATSVNFVKLTLGTVAPEIKGLHPHINLDLEDTGIILQFNGAFGMARGAEMSLAPF